MTLPLITLSGGIARNPLVRLDAPISFTLHANEHVAVVGDNAAGKSIFIDTVLGKYPLREGTLSYNFSPSPTNTVYDNVKYLTFRDSYGAADAGFYYQQRWNTTEQDDCPTVGEQLVLSDNSVLCDRLMTLFGIEALMNKKLLLLSSGELRKFQLVKALLSAPRVLIIDNPFIGLDAEARQLLVELLTELSTIEHLQIVLVLSIATEIPNFITHVVPVYAKQVGEKCAAKVYRTNLPHKLPADIDNLLIEKLITRKIAPADAEEVIRLNAVRIRYGERTILNNLNWVVKRGEKWSLTGENGAGKSTLLSLVCADNPQSYACDISLFGRKRGSGESIWDIKKRIGYVSPEMHRAYMKNLPAVEIVASGLYDTIGLYQRIKPADEEVSEEWMRVFGIEHLKSRSFLQLSSGEQRLVLLARAFVKSPELLVLDEPFHGLDACNRRRAKAVIEQYSGNNNCTLVMVTHYEKELPASITKNLQLRRNL